MVLFASSEATSFQAAANTPQDKAAAAIIAKIQRAEEGERAALGGERPMDKKETRADTIWRGAMWRRAKG